MNALSAPQSPRAMDGNRQCVCVHNGTAQQRDTRGPVEAYSTRIAMNSVSQHFPSLSNFLYLRFMRPSRFCYCSFQSARLQLNATNTYKKKKATKGAVCAPRNARSYSSATNSVAACGRPSAHRERKTRRTRFVLPSSLGNQLPLYDYVCQSSGNLYPERIVRGVRSLLCFTMQT